LLLLLLGAHIFQRCCVKAWEASFPFSSRVSYQLQLRFYQLRSSPSAAVCCCSAAAELPPLPRRTAERCR
jgi:hypothetical protein